MNRRADVLALGSGVGTAIGPLVVTVAILTGSWRPAYLTLTVLDLVIAGSWLRQRRRDGPASRSAEHAQANEPQSGPQWSRRHYGAVLAADMSVFFLYTGGQRRRPRRCSGECALAAVRPSAAAGDDRPAGPAAQPAVP